MLKKMKWRLIAAAMSAFTAVMVLLIVGINFWNYSVTVNRLDSMLRQIAEFPEFNPPPESKPKFPPMDVRNAPSKETRYMMRYFSAYLDTEGKPLLITTDFISSVSQETAADYVTEVFSKDKPTGFFGEYRYYKHPLKRGVLIVCLNVSSEQQFMKTLLLVSCLVGAASLGFVFLLVCLFSGKALGPYLLAMEKQKRFITDASHELKTPLTSISASADVLAMEQKPNEWVQNIQKQTVKLSKLVGNLVLLARLDEEEPFLEKETFSFSEIAWELAEPFASLAKAGGRQFIFHIEDGIDFCGDRTSLQQMMSILLDNAVKYSTQGGSVQMDLYRNHRHIVFKVSNTCDMDPNFDADRLFERFYRPDASRSRDTGGSGIGLSIAKAAAEAHKGRISVSYPSNQTICFQVVFS